MNKKSLLTPTDAQFYRQNLVKTNPAFTQNRLSIDQIIEIGANNRYTPYVMVKKFNENKENFHHHEDFFSLLDKWYNGPTTQKTITQKIQTFMLFIRNISGSQADETHVIRFLRAINDTETLLKIYDSVFDRFKNHATSIHIIDFLYRSIQSRISNINLSLRLSSLDTLPTFSNEPVKNSIKRKEMEDGQLNMGQNKRQMNDNIMNPSTSEPLVSAIDSYQSHSLPHAACPSSEDFSAFDNIDDFRELIDGLDETSIFNHTFFSSAYDDKASDTQEEKDEKNLRKTI